MPHQNERDGGALRSSLLAVAIAALVVTAGCSAVPGMGGDGADTGPALDVVPAGSNTVLYADVQGALGDDAVRTVLNGTVSAAATGDGPTTLDEAIAAAENDSTLDLDGLYGVTVFTRSETAVGSAADYTAVVVNADWSEDQMLSAVRNGSSTNLTETTYADLTAYHERDGDTWIGILDDGRFVVGSESAVKDAMDVSAGNADAFDNDVRSAFESTTGGHLRYAVSVPQEDFNASDVGTGQYSTAAFDQMTTVSGSLATVEGGNLSLTTRLNFSSTSAATDARDVLDGAVTTYRGITQDNTTERLLSEDHLSIEADGATVTVTATNEPETYVAAFRMVLTLGGVQTGPASTSASAGTAATV